MFSFFRKKINTPTPVLMPRIKQLAFLQSIDATPGMTAQSRPVAIPLAGDLILTLAVSHDDSYQMVAPYLLEQWQLDVGRACGLALDNGWQAMQQLRVQSDGILYQVTAPDSMAACSLLYPTIWERVEQQLGTPVLAWFAHRELVLYAADTTDGLAALRQAASTRHFDDPHALSTMIFRWVDQVWQPVAD